MSAVSDVLGFFAKSPAVANLVSSVAKSAGSAAVESPQVKEAIAAAQDELNRYRTVAMIAGGAAAAVFLFYYLPRFESPIPRIYRRRKS